LNPNREEVQVDRPLIVFDVEATGKNPDTASIIQIGATVVKMRKFETVCIRTFNEYIRPYTDVWEERAERVHGITREYLEEHGIRLVVALRSFTNWIRDCGFGDLRKNIYLATWGSGYDVTLLRRAYEYADLPYPFHYRTYDIASAVRVFLSVITGIGKKQGEFLCARKLGIDVEGYIEHDAKYDALVAGECLAEVCNRLINIRAGIAGIQGDES